VHGTGAMSHEVVVLPLKAGQYLGQRAIGANGQVDETGSLKEASRSSAADNWRSGLMRCEERSLRSSCPFRARMLGVLTFVRRRRPLVSESYSGRQFVGMDLHRRRSVLVRMTESGEHLETVRILNDRDSLAEVMSRAGQCPEVVLEATYGWVRSEGA
jgi:hypothetical protein